MCFNPRMANNLICKFNGVVSFLFWFKSKAYYQIMKIVTAIMKMDFRKNLVAIFGGKHGKVDNL